jgi:aryl-alcohol dehydrogenase-like predicted oxidoreductase
MKNISSMGYGIEQFGKIEQAEVNQLVAYALEQGINFFASAELYEKSGQASSKLVNALEEYKTAIAKGLRQLPKSVTIQNGKMYVDGKAVTIGTKVGLGFGENGACFTFAIKDIDESILFNRTALKLKEDEPLDIVLLHRIDDKGEWKAAYTHLIKLKNLKKIRHIGLSECGPEHIEEAVKLGGIDVVESAFSLSATRALRNGVKKACEKNNITFVGYTSVLRGLTDTRLVKGANGTPGITLEELEGLDNEAADLKLQDKVFTLLGNIHKEEFGRPQIPQFAVENIRHNLKPIIRLQQIAQKHEVSPTQLALAWVISQGVVPIPGTVNIEHLKENSAAMQLAKTLNTGIFKELTTLFSEEYPIIGDPNPVSCCGDTVNVELGLNDVSFSIKDGKKEDANSNAPDKAPSSASMENAQTSPSTFGNTISSDTSKLQPLSSAKWSKI